MQIRTAQSRAPDAGHAISEIANGLGIAAHGRPDFLAVHFGVGLGAADLATATRPLAGAVHGGSSCFGIMTDAGVAIETGAAVGAFAIWDAAGGYGTASGDLGSDAAAAAGRATLAALAAAGREGEIPDLVWLTVAPGREEQVIEGIRAVIGADAIIVGGSAADNDVSGQWAQFGPQGTHQDGVVVSVLFPSTPFASSYQGGYAPTGTSGLVTRADGRRLYEIDHQPAAEVYHRWTEGAVPMAEEASLSILGRATLWPLGRVTQHVAGVPFHLIALPTVAYRDGSLGLFAAVSTGDRLWQMRGSADSLVARGARVAEQACNGIAGPPAGALVIYCGACMQSLRDRMDEVHQGIDAALGHVPWMGVFTFGEQGVPMGGRAKHGNLMISCTTFGA